MHLRWAVGAFFSAAILFFTHFVSADIDVSRIAEEEEAVINTEVRVVRGWRYDQPGYEPDKEKVRKAFGFLFEKLHKTAVTKEIDGRKFIKTPEKDLIPLQIYLVRELLEARKNRLAIFNEFKGGLTKGEREKFEELFLKLDARGKKIKEGAFRWAEDFNDLFDELKMPILFPAMDGGECPSDHIEPIINGDRKKNLRKILGDHFKNKPLLSELFEEGDNIYAVLSDKERGLFLVILDKASHQIVKQVFILQKKGENWLDASSSYVMTAEFPYRLFLNRERDLTFLTEEAVFRFDLEGEIAAITPREITEKDNTKIMNEEAYQRAVDEYFTEGFGHLVGLVEAKHQVDRQWAMNALGKIGSSKAIGILTKQLSGTDAVRGDAIFALGKSRDRKAFELILERLQRKDESLTVRSNAARAFGIGKIKDLDFEKSRAALFAVLNDDNPASLKRQVIDSLAFYRAAGTSEGLKTFWEKVGTKEEFKIPIIDTLHEIQDREAGKFLIEIAQNRKESYGARKEAILAVATIKAEGGLPAIVEILKNEVVPDVSKEYLLEAVSAVGRFKIPNKDAVGTLIRILQDQDVDLKIRVGALHSLSEIGSVAAPPLSDHIRSALEKASRYSSESVSEAAKEALEKMRK